jgi:serine/threonine-protein kinase
MGAVYEALHEQIGKPVAVKVLLPRDAADGELIARFHREAQAAAAAGHRGIVDIYDVGVTADGSPFLVMELLRGRSLGALLDQRGSLDLPLTAYIACHVLSALSAAHAAGVVHRDLKPDNVFLVDSGAALPEVKLLDFGISRVVTPGTVTRMTRSGAVMGTPHYMSPEQAAGEHDIDHRTDLYSVGVILYECLTGVMPFDADNYNALLARIISTEPRAPRDVRPDLPPELEAAVMKALAKRRDHRHHDAAELFRAVLPYVDAGARATMRAPISSPSPQPSPGGRGGVGLPPTQPAFDLPSLRPSPGGMESPDLPATQPVPTTHGGRGAGRTFRIASIVLAVVAIGVIAGVLASWLSGAPSDEPDERPPAQSALDRSSTGPATVVGADAAPTIELLGDEVRQGQLAGDEPAVPDAGRASVAPRTTARRPPPSKTPAPTPRPADYGTEIEPPAPGAPRPPATDYGNEIE